jgi:segregation and condensation protein A
MEEMFELDLPGEPEKLTIAIDGWEGPLDLLLNLARTQKVDLKQISILALVEQYLAFINEARALKLELAADYLVMAAWLAYLKSALLLPRDPEVEPSPEELALRLQLRLQRLAAMRDAGARLMGRDRIGRDIFLRGCPEGLRVVRKAKWEASLYDLIAAYGGVKIRSVPAIHIISRRKVMTLEEAIDLVAAMVGQRLDWASLESFLPTGLEPDHHRSAVASSFVAALELARQGRLQLAQEAAFAPLMVRAA